MIILQFVTSAAHSYPPTWLFWIRFGMQKRAGWVYQLLVFTTWVFNGGLKPPIFHPRVPFEINQLQIP